MPLPPQRRQGGHVVAVAEPALDQGDVQWIRVPTALLVDHGHRPSEDDRVSLVEDDEDVRVRLLEIACRLRAIVETEHGRGRPAAKDPPAGLEPGRERRETEDPPLLGGRARVDAQPRLGDEAERALAADEELGQVGARGRPGTEALGAHHAARRPAQLRARRPCPRSSRSASSTGPPRGRPASPPRWRGPWTGASDRGCSRRPVPPIPGPPRGRGRTCRRGRPRAARSRRWRRDRPGRSCRERYRRGPGRRRRTPRCARPSQ